MAFIGAQRRPLTEEADGSGAGFSQEGQCKNKLKLTSHSVNCELEVRNLRQ
jgi:hypothetical protein